MTWAQSQSSAMNAVSLDNNLPNNHFFHGILKFIFVHDNSLMHDISHLAIVYIIDKNIHIH